MLHEPPHQRAIDRKKAGDPIDQHVGSRLRLRRTLAGMSQEKLAESIGVTFQQVQKYEKGTNRISASMLVRISATLKVPPAFFFDECPGNPNQNQIDPDDPAYAVASALTDHSTVKLVTAFVKLNPSERGAVLRLTRVMAKETGVGAENP